MPVYSPKAYAKKLGKRAEQRREQIVEEALVIANRGVFEGAETAERLGVVDRRTYIARFRAVPLRKGAQLHNDAPHAATIEYGRRPGAPPPPIGPILGWVRRKGIGLPVKGGAKARYAAQRAAAFLIARAIGRRGLPAHAIFRKHLRPKLVAWWRAALRRILASPP